MSGRTILICGNGASAAILLAALARENRETATSVIVIGRAGHLGEGVAYATANRNHLLNVPASRMSADPLQPDQFLRWLKNRGIAVDDWPGQFVPRALYAAYLDAMVRDISSANTSMSIRILNGEVQSLIRDQTSWVVSYSNGAPLRADIVVLATGNDMPTPVAGHFGADIARHIVDNPWAAFPIHPEESVLILGNGLTAIDTVITLLDRGHTGSIHLLSRRGLLPAGHAEPAIAPPLQPPWPATIRGLVKALRGAAGRRSSSASWQGLMDAMRPHWSRIWQGLDEAEKSRFLRHAATLWSAHRHRTAPQVTNRIQAALSQNVKINKGRLQDLKQQAPDTIAATIAYGGKTRLLTITRLINCSGPNSDPGKSNDSLIENIIASRQARATSLGIGLDVDEKNRVRDAYGMAQPSLFAMGPLTRGRWWEITAIPEITAQAADMAGQIMEQLGLLDAARVSQPHLFALKTRPGA